MNDWHSSHAFHIERAKREIEACSDTEQLRALCLNLLLQAETQREMLGQLLLRY